MVEYTLRPFKEGDQDSLVRHINNETIARNTATIPFPYTRADADAWIKHCLEVQVMDESPKINYAIDVDGEVVGSIGLMQIKNGHAEIGYWLGKAFWGKGMMTKVVTDVVNNAFRELELTNIKARVFPHNKGSMKVLEKVGFDHYSISKGSVEKDGEIMPEYLFRITRDAYEE